MANQQEHQSRSDACAYWKTEESSEVVSDVTDHSTESSQRQAASMIRICSCRLATDDMSHADMRLCQVAVSVAVAKFNITGRREEL